MKYMEWWIQTWDKMKDSEPCLKRRASPGYPKKMRTQVEASILLGREVSGVLREDTCIGNSGDLGL